MLYMFKSMTSYQKLRLRQSMHIYSRNNHARFHPYPIKNDGALGFLKSVPTRSKRTRTRSWVAIGGEFLIQRCYKTRNDDCALLCSPELATDARGVATGWISVFIPPKSAQVNFLRGKNDVRTAIQQFYTPPQKKTFIQPKTNFWLRPWQMPVGRIMRRGMISSCRSAASCAIVKRYWSWESDSCKRAIASTGVSCDLWPLPFTGVLRSMLLVYSCSLCQIQCIGLSLEIKTVSHFYIFFTR